MILKNTLAIIGSQWGDEGKGKLSDYFAQKSDVVVRWAGGDNAGHTIVINNEKYKLSLIPSGIFNEKVINIIANGCVININKLLLEIKNLQEKNIDCKNLFISNRVHIIMPYHLEIDEYQEKNRKQQIGTTKRGIGPCYEDKYARIGLRVCDLDNLETLKLKLINIFQVRKEILKNIYSENFENIIIDLANEYYEKYQQIKKYVCDTSLLLNKLIKSDKKILFEGAQGVMLDLDHGTYPYVTSSNPSASSIAVGAGIAPWYVNNIIGVTKAYNTRVGSGVFVSEINNDIAEKIRKAGNEYGTITLRPRRIGWLDIVILKHAIRINGFTKLAIMLLDVLTGLDKIKICVGYKYKNQEIDYILSDINEYEKCQPFFITLDGWKEDISKVNKYDDLPINAQKYLKKITELTGIEIILFSVGPERNQTILLSKEY